MMILPPASPVGSRATGSPSDPEDGASAPCQLRALADGVPDRDLTDRVAVEAPLEVHIGGSPVTVLMRTPGDDEDLVRGFLFGEGIITKAADITAIRRPTQAEESARGNIIAVELAASRQAARRGAGIDRLFYSSSSCGVCGKKTIAALAFQAPVCESRMHVSWRVLASLPDRLRAAQSTFALTGGVHASGLFMTDGELVVVREDVGRHNALDKVIGWALAAGKTPLSDYLLLVSGRVSYEIVQKAIVAGLPVIAAVGAPSSLAVELAERYKITLVGFVRACGMNLYVNTDRVVD